MLACLVRRSAVAGLVFSVAMMLALGVGATADAAPSSLVASLPGGAHAVQACPDTGARLTARCHAWIVSDAQGAFLRQPAGLSPQFVPGGYGANDLRSAYSITGMGESSTVIAIVDAYGYSNAEADLAVYRAQYGLPPCTTANGCFLKISQSLSLTNFPAQDDGWAQESAVDLDMASAMCPNCRLILVETDTANLSDLSTGVNVGALLGAHVISNSYGGTEAGTGFYRSRYNRPGIAVVASSGDTANEVDTPAAYPEVIAVGGTRLMRSAGPRGWTESAWAGAGAGCSAIFPKPSWQTDAGCAKRTVADISAVADPATPVAVYAPTAGTNSAWLQFGGTSVSTPLIAGIYGVNGQPVTDASDLYSQTYAINDITTGGSGLCPGYLCNAAPGYDGPTGLGTPHSSAAFGAPSTVPTLPVPLLAVLAAVLAGGGFVLARRITKAA